MTSIRNIKWQFQLLYGMAGIGNAVYIGAGGAIFINSYTNYKRLRYWRTWQYTYTVGDYAYKTTNYPGEVVKITKDSITVDYVDWSKHHGYFNCFPGRNYSYCNKYTNKPGSQSNVVTPQRALTEEEKPSSSPSSYTRMLQGASTVSCCGP